QSPSNPNVANPNAVRTIITIPHPNFTNHNGGTIAFGPDGYLYAGTGDGGSANDPPANAQNINVLLGKMIRIDIDTPPGQIPAYNIPPTNPY
ncbi:PQQ-dependent sugar dehydrogenase, partial [Escherichia coli]|nr:PQQ-dependent sugar dehydrogenase [Escherichia coli]